MTGQTIAFLEALLEQIGVAHLSPGNLIMIVIGSAIIYLAIVKHCEPLLLIGIGFACIVANMPSSAGIASVPIAARVSHTFACQENPSNFLIYHTMGPNLAEVFGTAISGGIILALLGVS